MQNVDLPGRRHLENSPCHQHPKYPRTVTQRFLLRDTNIEQLTQITFNEPIHTRNFRNVVINYPQRSKRSHAPFLDHLAHAFSLPTNDMASVRELLTLSNGTTWDATLTFLPMDVVNPYKSPCKLCFNNLTIDQLNPATSQALRQAAQTWIGTELEPSAPRLGHLGTVARNSRPLPWND